MADPLDYATRQTPTPCANDSLFVTERLLLASTPLLRRSRATLRITTRPEWETQVAAIVGTAVVLYGGVAIGWATGGLGTCGTLGFSALATFTILLTVQAVSAASHGRARRVVEFLSYRRGGDEVVLPVARRALPVRDVVRVECVTCGGLSDFESEIQLILVEEGGERRVGVVRVGFALRGVAAALARGMRLPFRDVIYRRVDQSPTVRNVDAAGRRVAGA